MAELRRIGPFVTHYAGQLAVGGEGVVTARRHRKRLQPLPRSPELPRPRRRASRLWQPARIGWWVAISFSIGSSCFLVGGALSSVAAGWFSVRPQTLNLTFAFGAVFFTLAAWGQFLEAVNAPPSPELYGETDEPRRWRWLRWRPHMIGWWASAVQLVGTLSFNLMTLDALLPGLLGLRADLLTWTPNQVGSLCFLIASQFALIEVCHRIFCLNWRELTWWIGAINMGGSIAFQLSAFFAWYRPHASASVGPWWDGAWTFVGACCFLVGALLLLPELAEEESTPAMDEARAGP